MRVKTLKYSKPSKKPLLFALAFFILILIFLSIPKLSKTPIPDYQTKGLDYYSTHKSEFIDLLNYYTEDVNADPDPDLKAYFDNYYEIVKIKNDLPLTELLKDKSGSTYALLIKDNPENCEHFVCLLIIDETKSHHDDALNLLKRAGYNPDNYQISWSSSAEDF